jgi:hypothetical protein
LGNKDKPCKVWTDKTEDAEKKAEKPQKDKERAAKLIKFRKQNQEKKRKQWAGET